MLDVIRRYIVLHGELDDEQENRMLTIARRCPVHRTLSGGPEILDEIDVIRGT